MRDRLKLPVHFSPQQLAEDLARLESSAWIDHFVPQNYQGNWSAVALRMPRRAEGMHPVTSLFSHWNEEGWMDAPILSQLPYFRTVLESFRCPLEAVRLMRLTVGSEIKEHRDPDLDFEAGWVRLHVPVQTNPEVDFRLNDRSVVMAVGECWYLRLSDPHRVHNRGDCDRIHLVIDARVNDWLESVFGQAEASVDSADAPLIPQGCRTDQGAGSAAAG